MPDRWVVALAGSAAIGALRPSPVPLLLGLAMASVGLLLQRPLVLCLAVALCTSALAQRALDGLRGLEAGDVQAVVVLLTDPEVSLSGLRAEARLGAAHVELRTTAANAPALRDRLAGERLTVRGTLTPNDAPDAWATVRHLAGRLQVHRVDGWSAADRPWRIANGLRRTIVDGADALDPDDRALFAGLVLGDDREQGPVVADDFQGAGLTHLLAVSGQNVAFVLALVAPLGRRLRLAPRLVLVLAVIGLFAVMTRFEPSVLRASAMAALVAGTRTAGLPAQRVRVLALAVTALLLLDPLLVHAVGFQLSAAATAAIGLGAGPIAGVLRGPSWLREALAVTIAAQLGVAPVLVSQFGPLPLASLPANVVAVPAAGLVMSWGLTGGLVAGLLGGPAAELLHLPTRALLGWLSVVARRSAALPLGELGGAGLALVTIGLVLAVVARRRAAPWWATVGRWTALLAVVWAVALRQAPTAIRSELDAGVVRWHAGATDVVVLGGGGWRSSLAPEEVLAALRRHGVGSIELLVVAGADVRPAVVAAVVARHPIGALVVPADDGSWDPALDVVRAPRQPTHVVVGELDVTLAPGTGRLAVDARPRGAPVGADRSSL
jgi:competence protein ComEC